MKKFFLIFYVGIAINNIEKAFGAEEGMPQLNPEYWFAQIFWLILIFSVLYLIIWKVFLPRISNNIENRRLRIINDLNETGKLKENAEKKLKEYNKIIDDAKNEAKKIISENKKKLDKDIKNKKQKFLNEIKEELLSVENEIQNLKKSSISSVNKIAAEISSEVIKQLIGSEANASNVSAIIEDISKRKMVKNQ